MAAGIFYSSPVEKKIYNFAVGVICHNLAKNGKIWRSSGRLEHPNIYIIPKTKKFGCVGRGDLTFFSKVVKWIEVRGDLSSTVENNRGHNFQYFIRFS